MKLWESLDTGLCVAEGKKAGQRKLMFLVPLDISVKDSAEAFEPEKGVLVRRDASVDIALDSVNLNRSSQFLNRVSWQQRRLYGDKTYSEWNDIAGQGTRITNVRGSHGIFQLRAKVIPEGGVPAYYNYVRKRDAIGGADSAGVFNPVYRKGQDDYIGVAKNEQNYQLAKEARSRIGSVAWAKSATRSWAPPGGVAGPGDPKCNIFVYEMSLAVGSSSYIPLDAGSWPPRAHEWYYESHAISGWNYVDNSIDQSPGSIISRYEGDSWLNVGDWHWPKSHGHTGILDYDGALIGAGPTNVNKAIHITTDRENHFKIKP